MLTSAPTRIEKDSKLGSQLDVQIRNMDPPTVPQGDQTCWKEYRSWKRSSKRLKEKIPEKEIITSGGYMIQDRNIPEKKKNTSDEGKNIVGFAA